MTKITYTRHGDYYLPNIVLREPPSEITVPLGRYARMRRVFLKEYRPFLYNELLLSEKLYPYLCEIDEAAAHRLSIISDRLQVKRKK